MKASPSLPRYTKGEEIFSYVSHIVGAAFGIPALVSCLLVSISHGNTRGIVCSIVYGLSMIVLYTFSTLYHALPIGTGKRVFRVLDHCGIYFLIAGTYTPIVLCSIAPVYPLWGWGIFAAVWILAAAATVFTAVNLKKYSRFGMVCYILMGWCILVALKPTLDVLPLPAFLWLLGGGASYSLGAVLYGIGKKKRWMHSIFHLFVLLGSILQYICVVAYVL